MNVSVSNKAPKPAKNRNQKSIKRDKIIVNVKEKQSASRPRPRKLKGISPNLTQEYYESLVDPFENQGCRLGWGCMTPSDLTTAYIRGSTAANADGTLAIAVVPSCKKMVKIGNGGLNVDLGTANVPVDATNVAAISSNYRAGRVISVGLKAFPSIAATDKPGVSYAGCLEPMKDGDLSSLTPADFISFPQNRQEIGSLGCSATGRPIDTLSFEFLQKAVDTTGYTYGGDQIPFTVPYVVFSGLPAGATVNYEAVLNLEVTYITAHGTNAIGNESTWSDSLANYWPNFESAWSRIQPYLPSPGQAFQAITRVAGIEMPAVHSMFGRLGLQSNAFQIGTARNRSAQRALPYYG